MILNERGDEEWYRFIEKGVAEGGSVLVHSVRGESRALAVIVCYLMKKYRWSLLKSLEFMKLRMPELSVQGKLIGQLAKHETYLRSNGLEAKTSSWNELFDCTTDSFENEELLLRNTYLNATSTSNIKDTPVARKKKEKQRSVRWAERLVSTVEDSSENVSDESYRGGGTIPQVFASSAELAAKRLRYFALQTGPKQKLVERRLDRLGGNAAGRLQSPGLKSTQQVLSMNSMGLTANTVPKFKTSAKACYRKSSPLSMSNKLSPRREPSNNHKSSLANGKIKPSPTKNSHKKSPEPKLPPHKLIKPSAQNITTLKGNPFLYSYSATKLSPGRAKRKRSASPKVLMPASLKSIVLGRSKKMQPRQISPKQITKKKQ